MMKESLKEKDDALRKLEEQGSNGGSAEATAQLTVLQSRNQVLQKQLDEKEKQIKESEGKGAGSDKAQAEIGTLYDLLKHARRRIDAAEAEKAKAEGELTEAKSQLLAIKQELDFLKSSGGSMSLADDGNQGYF